MTAGRCEHCGSEAYEVIERLLGFGGAGPTQLKVRCEHCGSERFVTDDAEEDEADEVYPAVRYGVTPCPRCGSTNTLVTCTRRPIRYHRCKEPGCGLRFKSIE
jgi:Zn finger protein HypA/HybF involved in hydrogenase expression